MESDEFEVRDHRKTGYYWVETAVLKKFGGDLGPYGIAAYNALACHADNYSQDAFPSARTIAEMTGMSRRQVFRELEKLEALGLVVAERHDRRVTRYTLIMVEKNAKKCADLKRKTGW